MSQPEIELRAALEVKIAELRESAKGYDYIVDDIGDCAAASQRKATANELERLLASRAPATTPTPLEVKVINSVRTWSMALDPQVVQAEIDMAEAIREYDAQAAAPGGHGFITGTAIPENFEPPLQDKPPGPRCSHGVLMREFCQGCEDAP